MKSIRKYVTSFLCAALILGTTPLGFTQQTDQNATPSSTTPTPVQSAPETPEQLQQLVAPIALYPDALVAQILGASTYPAQVVEADRWMQQHSNLKGDQLAQQVNQQNWDPSVKALTQYPSVLANLDKNITWTSGLGDAYTNQQQDVMNAVQVLRQRAQQSGNLQSTPQQSVTTQGQTIVIQPANPQVVYVPQYDPWVVYGLPVVAYPGWYPYPGLYIGGPGVLFGTGFGVGFFSGFGWGFNNWGFDWGARRVIFNRNVYVSHSRTFVNRGNFARGRADFNRGGETRGGGFNRGGETRGGGIDRGGGFNGGAPVSHGFAEPHGNSGMRSGAFSGFNHGGVAKGFSGRGASSFGGFHGGGGHGGGSHR